ncbi:MAG: replication restart helicase PriA [Candidatus Binatia bacterium]
MTPTSGHFARVIIPSPLKDALIYRVPPDFRDQISVGMRVLIPLGKRKVTGIVFQFLTETSIAGTKDILALQDDRPVLDPSLLQLGQWTAQYYSASLGEVLGTILPRSLKTEVHRTVFAKSETAGISGVLENRILEVLRRRNGKASFKTLTREVAGAGLYRAAERLESSGVIEIRERIPGARRRSKDLTLNRSPRTSLERLSLTLEQERALQPIRQRLETGGFETFLLHGVTGSGKTEIYLRVMELVRQAKRQSLILIPEISLTPQLLDRLTARFPGKVGVLHSGLTGAERWSQWWQILRGNVDVVVGARSAVFAPLPNLGLIVVDEEHDPSYKQEEGLRYNGRDLAVVRGKVLGCPVILGSATPAIESYENCLDGRYRLLEMTQRVQERSLPPIEIVDLRSNSPTACGQDSGHTENDTAAEAPRHKADHRLLSGPLIRALESNHQNGKQSLLFLNRRGYANFLQCRTCGYVLRCSFCSVTMTLHLKQKSVCCHHCNYRRAATDLCPGCGNLTLLGVGAGTEQIEDALGRLLPQARIARMDRDTTRKRGSHESLIRSWEKGEIDVLIGTQMITKGHDVSGVTLVGALLADLSLNLPDFRAAERTFQLLSQVAGRSGRGDSPGHVFIQTYAPDHYAVQHLVGHDYKAFFASEIEFRRALSYPPFSRLANLRVDGPKADEVEKKAGLLARALRGRLSKKPKLKEKIEILGPAPAPIFKLRNRYRWHMLLKAQQFSALQELALMARELLPRSRSIRLHVDVDPYNML